MKQFATTEKLDTGILYLLELASSLSVLLLAFGLIASMANVLTKGSVLTDNFFMQRVWAWTQCIAIDASVAGTRGRSGKSSLSRCMSLVNAPSRNDPLCVCCRVTLFFRMDECFHHHVLSFAQAAL